MGSINCNIDNRTIYIHDDINGTTMGTVIWNILEILNKDENEENKTVGYERKPIKIFINTNGGNLDDAWSLIEVMLNSKTPIHTYSTGYAHSCGFLIFIAGEKRFISKRTKMLYHQPIMGARGEYQFIKENQQMFDDEWEMVKEYVLERTMITVDILEDINARKYDWYLREESLMDFGVATDYISGF